MLENPISINSRGTEGADEVDNRTDPRRRVSSKGDRYCRVSYRFAGLELIWLRLVCFVLRVERHLGYKQNATLIEVGPCASQKKVGGLCKLCFRRLKNVWSIVYMYARLQ